MVFAAIGLGIVFFSGGWVVRGLNDQATVELAQAERAQMAEELETLKAEGAKLQVQLGFASEKGNGQG